MAKNAFHPVHAHMSKTLSISEAASNLSNYLQASEVGAEWHPDAILTSGGVQFPAHGGIMGGPALNDLRRIERGLKGEVLAPEDDEKFMREHRLDLGYELENERGFGGVYAPTLGQLGGTPKKSALKRRAVDDWNTQVNSGAQSMESWQLSQKVVVGDVGDRDTSHGGYVDDGYDSQEDYEHYEEVGEGYQGFTVPAPLRDTRDKDARKAEKKARLQDAKREKLEAWSGR